MPPVVLLALGLFVASVVGCAQAPDDRTPISVAQQALSPLPKTTITLSTGITMSYIEAGAPQGEAVIFLHGYTDTSRSFYPTLQALAARRPDLHLFALDQRGHGGSSLPDPNACRAAPETCFTMANFASDVIAFMDARGIGSAHLVGHSMGTLIAQEVALGQPQRVDSIVLIASTADSVGNPVLGGFVLADTIEGLWKPALEAQGYTYPDDVYALTPLDADPNVEAWLAVNWDVDPVANPSFVADIVPEAARVPLGTWIGAVKALLATDNTARLEHLTVPALVIWATQDNIFVHSPDQTGLIAALDVAADNCLSESYWKEYGVRPLPPSGLQETDLGHNTQWGAPRPIARDVDRWIRKGKPNKIRYSGDIDHPGIPIAEPGLANIVHLKGRCDEAY